MKISLSLGLFGLLGLNSIQSFSKCGRRSIHIRNFLSALTRSCRNNVHKSLPAVPYTFMNNTFIITKMAVPKMKLAQYNICT